MSDAVDLELANVEHELRTLQRVLEASVDAAPMAVTLERQTQLAGLRARRESLLSKLVSEPDDEPLTYAGLWEPLSLYPATPVVTGGAVAVSSPVRDELSKADRDALTGLGDIYERRFIKVWRVIRRLIHDSAHPFVLRVALAVADDFGVASDLLSLIRAQLNTLPREPFPQSVEVEPTLLGQLPEASDGLTKAQRDIFHAIFFGGFGGERVEPIQLIAEQAHLTPEAVVQAVLPLTLEGGARYPLLEHFSGRVRLTAFGNDLLVRDSATKSLWPRLPLLALLGHNAWPPAPPHHLKALTRALIECSEWPQQAPHLVPDPAHSGRIVDRSVGPHSTMITRASVTVVAYRKTKRARIEIRALPFDKTFESILQFLPRYAASEKIGEFRATLTPGLLVIELEHVAFARGLVHTLWGHQLTQHVQRVSLNALENGAVVSCSMHRILTTFLESARARVISGIAAEKVVLHDQIHIAMGLVLGARLHSHVDQIIAAATDADEAMLALTHLHDAEILTRRSFERLQLEHGEVAERHAALRAEFSLEPTPFTGFTRAQALALMREKRLSRQKEVFAARLRELLALRRSLDEPLDARAINAAVRARLNEFAERYDDERRTVVEKENAIDWQWAWDSGEPRRHA